MNIVDKIFFDPITKSLKFFGRNGESTGSDDNHAFHVYHSSGQSGNASNANPRVNFNTILYDSSGVWNGTSFHFKPRVKGIYQIHSRALIYMESGQGQMEGADGGLFKNGSTKVLSCSVNRGPNTAGHIQQHGAIMVGTILHTNLSDYYEVKYNATTFSGSFGIDGSGTDFGNCFLSGFLLKRL